jgi:hypothetical protein
MNIVLDVIVGVTFVISMAYMVPRLIRLLQKTSKKSKMDWRNLK